MKSRFRFISFSTLLIILQFIFPLHVEVFADDPPNRLIDFLISCEEKSQSWYDKYSVTISETAVKYSKLDGVTICTKNQIDIVGKSTGKRELFSVKHEFMIDTLHHYRTMAYSIIDSSNYRLPTINELLFCRQRYGQLIWNDDLNNGFIVAADTGEYTDHDHFYLFDGASGVIFIANLRKMLLNGNLLKVLPLKGALKDLKQTDKSLLIGYNTKRKFPKELSPNYPIIYNGFVDELKLRGKGQYNENLLIVPQFSNDNRILINEPITTYGLAILEENRIRHVSLEDEIINNNLRYPEKAGFSGFANILIDLEEVQGINMLYKAMKTKNKIEIAQARSIFIDSLLSVYTKYSAAFDRFCSNKYCLPKRDIAIDIEDYNIDNQVLSIDITPPRFYSPIHNPFPNDNNWTNMLRLCKSVDKLYIDMSLNQAEDLFANAKKIFGYCYYFIKPNKQFNSLNVQGASLIEIQLDIYKNDEVIETDDYYGSYVFQNNSQAQCWIVSELLKGEKINKPSF